MLTKEVLKSNEALKDLTEDQLNLIQTLSEKDENIVIASKTREIWDSVDADIKSVTGKEKPQSMKSYDFLKETLKNTGSEKVSELETKVKNLETERTELEKKIKDGNADEALKSQLAKAEKAIETHKTTIKDLKGDISKMATEHESKVNELQGENNSLVLETQFSDALSGVEFKKGIPESAIKSIMRDAKNKVMSLGDLKINEGDDGKTITFVKDDVIQTNPADGHKAWTAKSRLLHELRDIIDDKGKGGAGGKGGGGSINTLASLTGAKSKQEANQIIDKHLTENGFAKGTSEFQSAKDKLYEENKVSELPLV